MNSPAMQFPVAKPVVQVDLGRLPPLPREVTQTFLAAKASFNSASRALDRTFTTEPCLQQAELDLDGARLHIEALVVMLGELRAARRAAEEKRQCES